MAGMTKQEIKRLIHEYIGVKAGDLQSFSYSELRDFYALYCGLEIDPSSFTGTKRERFEAILSSVCAEDQAKIIRGTFKKLPPDPRHPLRQQAIHDEFAAIAERLEAADGVKGPTVFTSEVVRRAIDDARKLVGLSGATSGVDRVHTALHGYLKDVCKSAGIDCGDDPSITVLFKALRTRHPSFAAAGPRADDISRVLLSMATIMDAMNPIRNNASMAHPKELLEAPEAMLAINTAHTLLHYIDAKLP